MASTYTPNINLEEPARGDYVGTWDTPVNNNTSIIDLVAGAWAVINMSAGSVVLSAAQFQSKTLNFSSTLLANVTVTFPTSFQKSYEIYNQCTGSSAFTITLQTTSGGQKVCAPPGEICEVSIVSGNVLFKNLGRIGTYWDYAGSSVPNWVSGCTVPPYLNCDGTTFSSGTYPTLAGLIGTTLPDIRGTAKYALNQGTGRITAATGGLDGNTNFSIKTSQTQTIATAHLPPYTPSGTVSVISNVSGVPSGATNGNLLSNGSGGFFGPGALTPLSIGAIISSGTLTGTPQGGVSAPFSVIATGTVYGITMIRAA